MQEESSDLWPLLFIVLTVAAGTWIVTLSHIAMLIRSRSERKRQRLINERDNEITTEEEEGKRRHDKDNSLSPDFAALISAIKDQGRRNRNEERREEKGKAFREGLTILLLSGTLVAIVWQVAEMIRVYGPVRDQAKAARESAAAATLQARSAEEAVIKAQRAWVGPRNAVMVSEPAVGKPVEVRISYENSGREPGIDFLSYAEIIPMSDTGDSNGIKTIQRNVEVCRESTGWAGGSDVFPTTGGLGGGYTFSIKTKDDFVTDAMVKGDGLIAVEGCFSYRTFSQPKHTAFCYYYKQGTSQISALTICQTGNEAD